MGHSQFHASLRINVLRGTGGTKTQKAMNDKEIVPKELHKYLSHEYAIDILRHAHFYISRLDSYNDSYEATPAYLDFANLPNANTTIESQLMEINQTEEGHSFLKDIGLANMVGFINDSMFSIPYLGMLGWGALLLWRSMQQREKGNEARIGIDIQSRNALFKSLYYPTIQDAKACCFSESPSNAIMWPLYAKDSKGIVISFKPSIRYWKNIQFRKVQYFEKKLPLPDADANETEYIWELMTRKGKAWEYEKEWRLIDFDAPNKNFIKVEAEAITAIRLGLHINKQDKKEIIRIGHQKYPHAQIYQMKLNRRDDYELDFERIE